MATNSYVPTAEKYAAILMIAIAEGGERKIQSALVDLLYQLSLDIPEFNSRRCWESAKREALERASRDYEALGMRGLS